MMKRIYTFALLAALMLAGCEREAQRSDSPKRMVIDPTMVGMPLPTSRATETDFEQGDAIGLSVTTSGGERYASNARFLFDASQGRFLSADGLLWYEDVNATSTLFACYPYREGDALPASFTVAEDQNGGGYAASDLMTALKSDVRPTASAVGMTFRHRMARLIVNVDNRSGSPVDGIVVRNAVGRGLLDAADDTFRVDPDGAAVAVKARELTADAKYYVLLVPQSVRLEVEVTTAEGPRTYTLGEAELQGGKNHTLNVRILPAEMEVVLEDEITGWEDGDELFPEESLPGGDDGEQEGWLEYGGERYRTATLADGRTWMAENLRYVPQGRSVSSDPSDGSGIWYPCDLNRTASPGLVAQNGLLYSYPVLLGLDGPLSAENYNRSEGARGICPEGWHIPTMAEWLRLAGAGSGQLSDPESPYFDQSQAGAPLDALNADGFNLQNCGAINAASATATAAYLASASAADPTQFGMGYFASSTGYKLFYNTTDDPSSGLKNIQFYAGMTMWNTTYKRLTVAYQGGYGAAAVRCVKDL